MGIDSIVTGTGSHRSPLHRVLDSVRNRRGYALLREAWREGRRALRRAKQVDRRIARLDAVGPARGRVLIAYVVEGFFTDPIPISHTHYWEAVTITRIWSELGFDVDAIHNGNLDFRPEREYDFFISARKAMEPIGRRLNRDCVKVVHLDTCHWLFSNTATHRRTLDLQRRRGVTLRELLEIEPNDAIEFADHATMLGNDFTEATYAYAGKPIHRVPISTPRLFDWPEGKDFDACRTRFVWFGSRGAVHKGLDLVLEAFAGMPDFHLTVIGPIAEADFEAAYRRELYETNNIRSVGWIDLDDPTFRELTRDALALVFPSCAEAGSGSVTVSVHAGLIPVISRECGAEVGGSGILLEDSSIEEIRSAVRDLSSRPTQELERMARMAWSHARANHTREAFEQEYRRIAEEIAASES